MEWAELKRRRKISMITINVHVCCNYWIEKVNGNLINLLTLEIRYCGEGILIHFIVNTFCGISDLLFNLIFLWFIFMLLSTTMIKLHNVTYEHNDLVNGFPEHCLKSWHIYSLHQSWNLFGSIFDAELQGPSPALIIVSISRISEILY